MCKQIWGIGTSAPFIALLVLGEVLTMALLEETFQDPAMTSRAKGKILFYFSAAETFALIIHIRIISRIIMWFWD